MNDKEATTIQEDRSIEEQTWGERHVFDSKRLERELGCLWRGLFYRSFRMKTRIIRASRLVKRIRRP